MTNGQDSVKNKLARWEYMTMSYTYSYGSTTYSINEQKEAKLKNRPLHEVLSLFGQYGWELIGTADSEGKTFVFKRLSGFQVKQESPSEA